MKASEQKNMDKPVPWMGPLLAGWSARMGADYVLSPNLNVW